MASELTGRERKDFWTLTCAQFLMFCGFFSFFQFPVFIKAVGGGETAIGVMGGLGAFAATLFIPWIADFVNRSERKRLMRVGIGITALSTLGALTVTRPDAWMAVLLISRGLGFAIYNNSAGAYIAEILPARERSRWIGVNFGVNQIAVAVGPALAELLIVHAGFPAFFLMAAGFEIAAVTLLGWISRRAQKAVPSRTGALQTGRVFFSTVVRRDIRHLYLTLLLMSCGLGAVFNFTATYLREVGLTSAMFFTVYALINGGSRIAGGGLSDRFGRWVIVVPMLSLFALGLLLYSLVGGIVLMTACALLIGLGFGLSNPALLAQLLDKTGPQEQGRIVGGFHFAYQLGALCSTPIFGVVADGLGYPAMWRMAGLIVLASTILYGWTEYPRSRGRNATAESG